MTIFQKLSKHKQKKADTIWFWQKVLYFMAVKISHRLLLKLLNKILIKKSLLKRRDFFYLIGFPHFPAEYSLFLYVYLKSTHFLFVPLTDFPPTFIMPRYGQGV